jgi:hypothetical protein
MVRKDANPQTCDSRFLWSYTQILKTPLQRSRGKSFEVSGVLWVRVLFKRGYSKAALLTQELVS